MRQVGEAFERASAERFVRFLASQSIEAMVRERGDGAASVWVIDDADVPGAQAWWEAFRASPSDARFNAPNVRVEPPTEHAYRAARSAPPRPQWSADGSFGGATVTNILVALAIVATVMTSIGNGERFLRWLLISNRLDGMFIEVLRGEVWRLVTPIFPHGGILHIFFNVLWVRQIGSLIERTERSGYFAGLVLVTAVVSNVVQYIVGGPAFLGMSGVLYALFGYVWIMARLDARRGYWMSNQTVVWMLGWLIACWVGLIPHVANGAHVGGLVAGVVWGLVRSRFWSTWLRRRRWRG